MCLVEVLRPAYNDVVAMRVGWANYVCDPSWERTFGKSTFFTTAAHVLRHAQTANGMVVLRSPRTGEMTQPFVPRLVLNGSRSANKGIDLAYFAVPMVSPTQEMPVGALLGIKAAIPATIRKNVAVTIYSPPAVVGGPYRVSRASVLLQDNNVGVAYQASTTPGSSGSGLFQQGRYVGFHSMHKYHPRTKELWNAGAVHLFRPMPGRESAFSDDSGLSVRDERTMAAELRAEEAAQEDFELQVRGFNDMWATRERWEMLYRGGNYYLRSMDDDDDVVSISESTFEDMIFATPADQFPGRRAIRSRNIAAADAGQEAESFPLGEGSVGLPRAGNSTQLTETMEFEEPLTSPPNVRFQRMGPTWIVALRAAMEMCEAVTQAGGTDAQVEAMRKQVEAIFAPDAKAAETSLHSPPVLRGRLETSQEAGTQNVPAKAARAPQRASAPNTPQVPKRKAAGKGKANPPRPSATQSPARRPRSPNRAQAAPPSSPGPPTKAYLQRKALGALKEVEALRVLVASLNESPPTSPARQSTRQGQTGTSKRGGGGSARGSSLTPATGSGSATTRPASPSLH